MLLGSGLRIAILSLAHMPLFGGGKCFDCADGVALPNDAADHSSTLIDRGWICVARCLGHESDFLPLD